jgi:3-hydroxyisobutyryl-CoA hydrolase
MAHPDFTEGVTARLINKPATTPKWSPASLADMTDEKVDEFFKMEGLERLPLLNPSAEHEYKDYPYAHLALPREADIERVVRRRGQTRGEVVRHFEHQRDGKMGVREKVLEVLQRKTTVNEAKQCAWIAEP